MADVLKRVGARVTEAPPAWIRCTARFEMKLVPPIPRGSLAGAEEFARAFAKAVMLPEKRVVLTDVSSTGQFVTLDMMPDTQVYRYVSCDTECVLDKCERLCGILEAAGHRIDHRFGVRSTRPPSVAKRAGGDDAAPPRRHRGRPGAARSGRRKRTSSSSASSPSAPSWSSSAAPLRGAGSARRRPAARSTAATHQQLRQKEDWFKSIRNSLGM